MRVSWVGFKRTLVRASVVVHRAEDRVAIERRLRERLDRVLSPVPVGTETGWPFGEHLRVAKVYDVLQSRARRALRVGCDPRRRGRAGCRPLDRARSESAQDLVRGERRAGLPHRRRLDGMGRRLAVRGRVGGTPRGPARGPGCVVATARVGETEASVVHASMDYGETWVRIREFDSHVEEVALALIDGQPHAFLATDAGLFRQPLQGDAVGDRILVVAEDAAMGFYAVSTSVDPSGALCVAAAAQELKGVFVSFAEGRPGTFVNTGLKNQDIRVLRTLEIANRRYLYAGAYATGEEEGAGVSRVEVLGVQLDAKGWEPAGAKWTGGSCRDIAFIGETVLAATERAGVAVANPRQDGGSWRTPTRDCGLPLRQNGTFQALFTVAANDVNPPLALCGGPDGVFRSSDGRTWRLASPATFDDEVSLPPNWLFAPGAHEITVEYDDAG